MNILTLNAGSSSLKYKLFAMPSENVLERGALDRPGGADIAAAAAQAIDSCRKYGIDGVGHRVVHGGSRFFEPTRVTPSVLNDLQALRRLDPLHNPTETAMIAEGLRRLPNAPAVAVFDTAFHRTMPEVAWRYALPEIAAAEFPLRRYGFHGISYEYVSQALLACLGRQAEGSRLIVCHLGSGASVCALRDGKSADTSMGMTPLAGLVMGTRSGDVDPGLLLYVQRAAGLTPEATEDLLNRRSGLIGLAGQSDVRELELAATAGDGAAETALEIFAYSVSKYIGAYAAVLNGVDAVGFTGGIGEHSPTIRERVCRNLGYLGLTIDTARNDAAGVDSATDISAAGSSVATWVVPTDEELQIARCVYRLLTSDSAPAH